MSLNHRPKKAHYYDIYDTTYPTKQEGQPHNFVEEWNRIISFLSRAGLVAFILNMTMIFIGYYMAKYLASGLSQRKCISLECGLQNGTLAVFVATQLFDDIVFMVPTAAYALIMFVTSIIFVLIVRKIN